MNEFLHRGLVRLQTGASQQGAAIKFWGCFHVQVDIVPCMLQPHKHVPDF